MDYFAKGEFFPPVQHQDRIKRYKENRLLFEGKHWDLFRKHSFSKANKLYISVNLAGLIAKKSADFLIGDGVTVSAGKEDNSPEQLAFDRLEEDNDLDVLFYESALSNAYKGDSFFKVRYGQEFGGLYPKEIDEFKVRIETVNSENVFPETAAHNEDLIVCYHIAVPIRINEAIPNGEKNQYKLQVESHTAGKIDYREFELKVLRSEYDGTPIEWKIGEQIGETDSVSTGVSMPLVVHVPNFSTADTWEGMDDLTEIRPLFDELNNRLTQIASIMDKHSDPAMAIPSNILDVDEYGRPVFRVADSKVFEVEKQDVMPQYITWNGQLNEAYQEIDRLTTLILTTAEIPEVALGLGDTGTSGSSGLAIKWRMNSLLSKIKRKRKYYEKALKRVFLIAQSLESSLGIANYEVTAPKLIFTDGLPKDEAEQTSIALQATGGAILMSQKTAIMQRYSLTEEQADAEIARIEEEQKKLADSVPKGSPSLFNEMDLTEYEEDESEEVV